MPLPQLEFRFEYQSKEGKVYSKPIFYRPYISDDEKYLLMGMQSMKGLSTDMDLNAVGFINDFIKRCVIIDQEEDRREIEQILDTMSYIDKIWLFFLIRAKSYSNTITYPKQCSKCGEKIDIKVDIEKEISLSHSFDGSKEILILPDGNSVELVLKTPRLDTFGFALELKTKWESMKQNDVKPEDLDDMFKQIDKMLFELVNRIVMGGKLYDNDDVVSFNRFFRPIPSKSKADLLTKILDKIPQFVVDKVVKCNGVINSTDSAGLPHEEKCGESLRVEEKGVISFL